MIKIKSPSRLHLGLIDLNAECGRVDGGTGLTLEYPHVKLKACKAEKMSINTFPGSEKILNGAKAVLGNNNGISFHVETTVPVHVGLGSGTQYSLCGAMAANRLYGLKLSVRELASRTGRGGTSGIGIESFENGGFIVDGGHKFSDKKTFSPSSASKATPAPILFRKDFPEWYIVIVIPNLKGAYDKEECDLFRDICPIPLSEVQEISHIILMQLIPSVIEKDILYFSRAINNLQKTGFKKREISIQPPIVGKLMAKIHDFGALGVGMSSFGPTIYSILETKTSSEKLKREIESFFKNNIDGEVIVTKANNSGAVIEEVAYEGN